LMRVASKWPPRKPVAPVRMTVLGYFIVALAQV
jgi:hypothetical protein